MSNDKTGILWLPDLRGLLGVREDGAALFLGSSGVGIYWGSGSPDGVLTAAKGSLFIRTDTVGLFQNTDGASAWTAFATA